MSVDRSMDKENVVHTYNRKLLSHKKRKTLPFVTAWMNQEDIMLSETSQTQKDKYCMISILYGI